jgi:ADP-ribose pyrophosphatase
MGNKTIFKGNVITLAVEDAHLPNGSVHKYEVIHHPGGACAVPIFENGDVLLLRQYRHPAGDYLWELPAGKLDVEGETPEQCAARELIEESGYEAAKLEKICDFYSTPGFTDEILHIYKATELKPAQMATETHEIIEVHRFKVEQIDKMISGGEIRDGKTLLGLYACGFGN